MKCALPLLLTPGLALLAAGPVRAEGSVKVILDTDIGGDVDDAFCLALALCSPEVDLLGVTVSHGPTSAKARIACKMLHVAGRDDVPVAVGRGDDSDPPPQCQWAADFTDKQPIRQTAADFIIEQVRAHPGEVVLVPVGAQTNIADALDKDPEIAGMIPRIVTMAGAAYIGYNLQPPPVVEWNVKCDIPACQRVFSSGIPIQMAGLDITAMMRLDAEMRERLFSQDTPLTDALKDLYELWGHETPVLYDPVALAWAFGRTFSDIKRSHVAITDEGMTEVRGGFAPNAEVGVSPRTGAFMGFYVERILEGCR